jgi:uncharacterized OsmC-like protein
MTTASTSGKPVGRVPVAMNGVDTPKLLATIQAVGAQPELAKFQFRAQNRWIAGTGSETTIHGFSGAGGEHRHISPCTAVADHPEVLCGADRGPTPVEWLLHALASCLMAGVGNIAAARGVKLNKVAVNIEGEIDLRGLLGLAKDVRTGFQRIEVSFDIDGDAPPEKLADIVRQSKARSAVYDVVTNGVDVGLRIKTPQVA